MPDNSNSTSPTKSPARTSLEAKASLAPHMRHAMVGMGFAGSSSGFGADELVWKDMVDAYGDQCAATRRGDLGLASHLLTSQAITLDAVFTDMLLRSSKNLGQFPEAAERYMRLALKAQANSRATIEALTKLHQPREQIVRHVTVHEGGQAIVADEFHQHQHREGANEKSTGQPHAAASTGTSAALPSPDALGNGVPIAGDAERALSNARREEPGRADG